MISKTRYSILFHFILFFLIISVITRTVLLVWSFHKADPGIISCLRIYGQGLIFDTIVAFCFSVVYSIYLLILPQRWNTSLINRVLTCAGFFLTVLIIMFSFFAEFAFWDEFESRFNFIAVDYLVYTFEVINNIHQSYPLPWLISGMVLLTLLMTFIFYKRRIFQQSFKANTPCSQIDMFATLFGLLNWQYESNWYGKNVLSTAFQPRAYVATYQKLGYLQHDTLVTLSPNQQITTSLWNAKTDEQQTINNNPRLDQQAIAAYQSAYYLYKNGGLKE